MDKAGAVATSSATRVLNQQDYLGYVRCVALRTKRSGMKGTSRNLPVTPFKAYLCCSQQKHHTVCICSEFMRRS